MLSSNQSRFIFAVMLTFIVLSPCVISVSNTNFVMTPRGTMELAAPTITGPTVHDVENGTISDTLEYDAFDADPKNYSVTVDGGDYDSGIWDGGTITVYLVYLQTRGLINTLPQAFAFEVTVFNNAEESASASTTVNVILDTLAPAITQPANITYEAGSFGNEIRWNITESNPDFYNISRTSNEPTSNSSVLETGDWDGNDIVIDIDGLNASRWYLYKLFVNDTFGMNSTSFVNVTVLQDLTAPVISSPNDVAFEFGATGFEIRWHAYDSNPKNYTIVGIINYNDTFYGNYTNPMYHSPLNVTQPTWTFADSDGGDISISLDWLYLGNYTFIITAFDIFNQTSSDSVFLEIYPDIRAPIIVPSDDLVFEEGYSGFNVTWGTEENNPLWYNLTLDGSTIMNGTWRGENFTVDVNVTEVGTYVYNMTLRDFFGFTSFAVIQVDITVDIHPPIIAEVKVIQTLSSQTTNNLTVQAYAWDLNNIEAITIEWGIGDPESATFVPESSDMILSDIADFFTAELGEFTQGSVVWYRITAVDNSSVGVEETTEWLSVTVSSMSYQGAPALLYGIIGIFGSLSLLIFIVMYFRARK
jgi:hypothetical protein